MHGVVGAQVYFNKEVRERPVAVLTSRLYATDYSDSVQVFVGLSDIYIRDKVITLDMGMARYDPHQDRLSVGPALSAIRFSPIVTIDPPDQLSLSPGVVMIKPSPYLQDVDPDSRIALTPATVLIKLSPILRQPDTDILTTVPGYAGLKYSKPPIYPEDDTIKVIPGLESITLT